MRIGKESGHTAPMRLRDTCLAQHIPLPILYPDSAPATKDSTMRANDLMNAMLTDWNSYYAKATRGPTITLVDGNHELIIDGKEIWVGTRAECKAKLSEHLAAQEVSV